MIASTASASDIENTIFTIVWPTRHLMARSEGDWRVSFAKCATSASGAGIAEEPQPSYNITVSKERRGRFAAGSVPSACAAPLSQGVETLSIAGRIPDAGSSDVHSSMG